MNLKTREITITGMGIALFVVLSLCLQVPVFENYYLCLGYVVMTYYCYHFGAAKGAIVGCIGTILYCLMINGLRGMPGWSIGNIFLGIIMGHGFKMTKRFKDESVKLIFECIIVVLGTACSILGIKSIVEVGLYAQPFLVRVASNIYAFVADVVVILLLGLPLSGILKPRLLNYKLN